VCENADEAHVYPPWFNLACNHIVERWGTESTLHRKFFGVRVLRGSSRQAVNQTQGHLNAQPAACCRNHKVAQLQNRCLRYLRLVLYLHVFLIRALIPNLKQTTLCFTKNQGVNELQSKALF
jgi:hypothetical protein